jgi:hypothetical protein
MVDFRGPNSLPRELNHRLPQPQPFLLQDGSVRDLMPETMTIYLDEYAPWPFYSSRHSAPPVRPDKGI